MLNFWGFSLCIDKTYELSEYSLIEDNLRCFEVVIYTWYTSDIQVVYTRFY